MQNSSVLLLKICLSKYMVGFKSFHHFSFLRMAATRRQKKVATTGAPFSAGSTPLWESFSFLIFFLCLFVLLLVRKLSLSSVDNLSLWHLDPEDIFQVKEVKDAKVEDKRKEEEAEEEKTVKREGMMVDSDKDVVDLVSFSDIIFVRIILASPL